jgi:DNA/RNA endonuclease YhcR with UshA esterase domain
MITANMFENKTIDVKGLVDLFDGTYQIKVFSIDDITIY